MFNSYLYDLRHYIRCSFGHLMMYNSYWDVKRRVTTSILHGHCKTATNHRSLTLRDMTFANNDLFPALYFVSGYTRYEPPLLAPEFVRDHLFYYGYNANGLDLPEATGDCPCSTGRYFSMALYCIMSRTNSAILF